MAKETDPSQVGRESTRQKLSPLERRDPNIRTTMNSHLDNSLEILGPNDGLNASGVGNKFPLLRRQVIERGLREKWISPRRERDTLKFSAVDIVTLMYLGDQGNNLPPQLKKQVRGIAEEEYRKRLNNKDKKQ